MSAKVPFWFHAEPIITAVRVFAERLQARHAAQSTAIAAMATAVARPPRRSEVTEVTGFGRPLAWGAGATATVDVPTTQDAEALEIIQIRGEIREGLRRLEQRLAQGYREPNVRAVMAPLVIHSDERLMVATRGGVGAWTPLQLEILGFDDGGVQFYTLLEEHLAQAETPALVFEVYYFCLRDGFKGLYADNPARIEDYKERLAKRLSTEEARAMARPEVVEGQVTLVEFPYQYYLAAAGAVAGTCLLLLLAGYLHSV
jgi:type IV/VI secretion system ImpK/VasF family protein